VLGAVVLRVRGERDGTEAEIGASARVDVAVCEGARNSLQLFVSNVARRKGSLGTHRQQLARGWEIEG
jgi:hypothetical protein